VVVTFELIVAGPDLVPVPTRDRSDPVFVGPLAEIEQQRFGLAEGALEAPRERAPREDVLDIAPQLPKLG